MPSVFTARICWNSKGWRFPAGEAKSLESGTYVTEMGFGHEEWLFNYSWMIGRQHFAFLQPVGRSHERLAGKTIHIFLYAIDPVGRRIYAGELVKCHVLTLGEANAALGEYRKRGWLKHMARQVVQTGGDRSAIDNISSSLHILNVRFSEADALIYDPPRVAAADDFVQRLNRYTLAAAKSHTTNQWRNRKGTRQPRSTNAITRSAVASLTYDPQHALLQRQLFKQLLTRYGAKNVVMEQNDVDVTVTTGKRRVLIEIKSTAIARAAVREALGQLLEYAYYRPSTADCELIVVSPGASTPEVANYVQRLRSNLRLPISYRCYRLGDVFGPL